MRIFRDCHAAAATQSPLCWGLGVGYDEERDDDVSYRKKIISIQGLFCRDQFVNKEADARMKRETKRKENLQCNPEEGIMQGTEEEQGQRRGRKVEEEEAKQ